MATASINALVAAPAATPASPNAGAAAGPGEFARQLERAAAQDGDADAPPAAASPQETANPARDARSNARPAAERGKPAERVAERSGKHEGEESGVASDEEADLATAAGDRPADTDVSAWLAEMVARQTAATTAPHAGAKTGGDAAQGADSVAGRGLAATPAGADAAAGRGAGSDSLPALGTEPAPAFMLPQTTATSAADAGKAQAAPAPYAAQIAAPLGSPDFAPGLSAQVSLMLRGGVQEARLQLNPAEMGPITVQIQIDGSSAQVTMAAQQAPTRDALQQAMPTLAGALREEGLTLTGGGVFEQPRQPRDDAAALPQAGGPGRAGEPATAEAPAARWSAPRGVVDLYA